MFGARGFKHLRRILKTFFFFLCGQASRDTAVHKAQLFAQGIACFENLACVISSVCFN